MILLAYNRLIHHSNDNDKNVHPLNSPKLRMAKVRNEEKLKKQILDQITLLWIKNIEIYIFGTRMVNSNVFLTPQR